MSLVNLLPQPQALPPVPPLGQRRTSRTRPTSSSRPSTALLEPLVSGPSSQPEKNKKVVTSSRPQSGNIRPLSSRVYMRRTVKNGWVAKGIHEEEEDEDEDKLSNAGSLDSFFDDDFDNTPQSQVLEGFLSCNTLGVESKNGKNDWVAGDVAIPKFHCPRCRDHWYGLSSFPCDDELARLIREGKWYTGKEGNDIKQGSNGKAGNLKSDTSSSAINASNSSTRLPGIRKRVGTGISRGNSDRNMDFINPHAKDKNKKSRRISFKLDGNSDNDLTNSGSSGLLQDESGSKQRLNRGTRGGSGGYNEGDSQSGYKSGNDQGDGDGDRSGAGHIESSSSASDVNSGSSTTLLRNGAESKGNKDQWRNSSSNDKLKGYGGIDGSNKKDLSLTNNKGGKGRKIGSGSNDGGGLAGSGKEQFGKGRSTNGMEGYDRNNGSSLSDGDSKTGGGDREIGLMSGHTGNDSGSGLHKDGGTTVDEGKGEGWKRNRNGGQSSHNSSRRGSRSSSLNGGSQRWSDYGDGEGGNDKRSGKGRDLVAGKGYMRASSPSQTEWGDPTHAKAWLSNTASSSRVSLTNQSHKDNTDVEEIFLPPIKNPPKNPFSSLDFMDGFNLTRAFSFSYY